MTYPYPPLPRRRRHNWKLTAGIIAAVIFIIVGLIVMLLSAIRNADTTRLAVHTAESNPSVIAVTGSPLTIGRIVSGNIEKSTSGGKASLSIPVSGPKGKGTLYTEAHESEEVWKIDTLDFAGETGQPRHLIPDPDAKPSPEAMPQ